MLRTTTRVTRRAAMAGLALLLAPPVWAEGEGFTFAQAADTHFTDAASATVVAAAVTRLNADARVAFSLWLGDLTQSSKPAEMALAKTTLSALQRPWYAVRGNHDRTGDLYQQHFGPLRQAFDHGGWTFLLVDSCALPDGSRLGPEELAWLRERLATIDPHRPLVLACHHPLMPHSKAYAMKDTAEVLALFGNHNLRAVLGAHYHGNQEEVVDGVLFTTTACLATTRTNFDRTTAKGYRLFHCRGETITTEFVTVLDDRPPTTTGPAG